MAEWEVILVPHCLQARARGTFGRGRDVRLVSLGGAGNLRGVDEVLIVEWS